MHDINFFQQYLPKPKKKDYGMLLMLILLLLVVCAIAYFEYDYYMKSTALKTHIKEVEAKNKDPETLKQLEIIDRKNQIHMSLDQTLGKLSIVDSYMNLKKTVYAGLLTDISDSVPEKCYISDISIENDTVNITGFADSYESVAQFQHQLRELDKLQYVFSPNMAEQNANYAFTLAVLMKVEVDYEEDK